MASNVRVFHAHAKGAIVDNHQIAGARVQLKLYSLSYVEARHGADGGPGLCWDALVLLCQAAIRYVRALEGGAGGEKKAAPIDRTIRDDNGSAGSSRTMMGDRVGAARTQLKLATLAYEATRRGADGGIGFARDGLALLCQSAIHYVEALDNTDRSHLVDRLAIEDSM
jgi:hypothetical protein